MPKINAAITGVHAWVPEKILSNFDLEKMVDTNDEWIRSRTGIKERRILDNGKGVSEIGIQSVKALLKKTNTDPLDIELVIFATITSDFAFPDAANLVSHELGMKNAFTYDLGAACSGFMVALSTGAKYIESGSYNKVLIIGADKMSSIINYEDRNTCIIFGDGGGAVLLEPTSENVGLQDEIFKSDGSGKDFLILQSGGSKEPITVEAIEAKTHLLYQEGRTVFKWAVKKMSSVVEQIMKNNNLTSKDIKWLIPHQANIRIIESVAKMANFPMEQVAVNIEKYGNTTAGTLPLCLWEWESKLEKGDNIILTSFGGGFTWGAILLKWAY